MKGCQHLDGPHLPHEDAEDEGSTTEDEDPAARDEGLAMGVEGLGMDDESYGLDDESHGMDDEGRGLDDENHSVESDGLGLEKEEEVVPGSQQQAALVVGTTVSAPLGLRYGALRRRELALKEDQGENQDLRLQLVEERRARLELAEVDNNMRRGQEPRGGLVSLVGLPKRFSNANSDRSVITSGTGAYPDTRLRQ
ncbi:hypothetical protein Tco_0555491 [Tanacetum coccineum]